MRLHALGFALLALPACAPASGPVTTDRVDLLLYSPACTPDTEPPFENWIDEGDGLTIAWDVLCHRDDADTAWFAVKVSLWEDRADDLWNVWYLDPTRRGVEYAEEELPGADLPENPDSPLAQVRVVPRELIPGDYRVEVWEVPTNQLDAVVAEAKLTVLAGGE